MKNSAKNERSSVRAIIIGATSLIWMLCTGFLARCVQYIITVFPIHYSEWISSVDGYVNRQGWHNGWTESLTAMYNNAVASKAALIAKSDICMWFYQSGATVTGWVARILVICVVAYVWWRATKLFVSLLKKGIKYLLKKSKHQQFTTYDYH